MLSLLSAVLFWLAWPAIGLSPLLFVFLVPLFLIEEEIAKSNSLKSGLQVFKYCFVAFLIGNILTTWWIWNASGVGMVIAVLLNAFLMSWPFYFYHRAGKLWTNTIAFICFVSFWMAYEYFHLNWDLSWPWMNLGNGLANRPKWIQWYEFTGTFGGTLWILSGNILAFELTKQFRSKASKNKLILYVGKLMAIVILPVMLSLFIYDNYEEEVNPANVVVVQPNIDPYNEKFAEGTLDNQLGTLKRLSDSLAQVNTEFFVWSETAIPSGIYEDKLLTDPSIDYVRQFLSTYKNGNVVTGASTYRYYSDKATATARAFRTGGGFYDAYNTALLLENSPKIQVYHKSKLVPGVEQMPYPALFSFLEPLALNLGGTMGSLGKQEERTVLYSQSGIGIAPVICYESIYGEYLTEYIRNGAQLIFIITNDGWWGNTPGYKQHATYASLRAIETRRSIARSANTGISCFVNQRGDIEQATNWWEPKAIKADLNLNSELTFYVKYGDWLAKGASVFALLFFVFIWMKPLFLKNHFRKN